MWLKAHWRTAAGTLALLIPLWQVVRSVLSTWGDIEFVIQKANEPGWVATVWAFVVDPPGYIILPLLIVGMSMIWLDVRRRREREPMTTDVSVGSVITSASAKSIVQEVASKVVVDDGGPVDVYSPGGRVFDHYFSIYNNSGGSIGFAIRQDSKESPPYVWVDQNEKKYGRRSMGKPFDPHMINLARQDLLSRQKKGRYNLSRSP